jgi:hypothetical protein
MDKASSFSGALPTIDLCLSESQNAICAALLVDDPMVVSKTNHEFEVTKCLSSTSPNLYEDLGRLFLFLVLDCKNSSRPGSSGVG